MNHVSLIGHLTADPEIRETAEGGRVVLFTVATIDDEPDSRPERSRVSVSDIALAAFAVKHFRKGSQVHIEGSLHTRYWVDSSNIERYATEVDIGARTGILKLVEEPARPESAKTRTADAKLSTRSFP